MPEGSPRRRRVSERQTELKKDTTHCACWLLLMFGNT